MQTHLNQFLKYRVMNEVQTKLLIQRNSNKSGLTSMEYLTGAALKRGSGTFETTTPCSTFCEDQLNWDEVPEAALEALTSANCWTTTPCSTIPNS